MKKKDLMFLLLAVGILLVAGYIGYTQLVPKSASSATTTVKVEKVGVFDGTMDSVGITAIEDESKVVDYNSPTDLSGLGNAAPFGP
jgi:hypothetical protein